MTINDNERQEEELAAAIYKTFNTADGKTVLSWILYQCGYFVTKPSAVSVDLIAFANRLMQAGHMTITGNMGKFARAIIESYEGSSFKE
ncbi:MAG: hypothetical protein WCR70_04850 [Sphaerochaetaceae bacterium]